MESIILLFGSNIGDKTANLTRAVELCSVHIGSINKASSLYSTEPWGKTDQDIFINQVVSFNTNLSVEAALTETQKIEMQLGRVRKEKWGSRTIDIDILYFGNLIKRSKTLFIPHPEIGNRRFTLVPLVEIAPDFKHPVLNITNEEMLNRCEDKLGVVKLKV
ncbi:MAG: 2-amino-4-hydroxy-6-hydroxymethyldihydropteridine diphosphokinase [Sporocytophaga sp.]|uniref:2-amino-4-hydroxy-6- hydroxymethyldihydropteridine diphosphokinase n=1 Tax=Sporocytophaga sp. TaxID=2231183 RepID=UPI001B2C7D0B|nr:2-amino-4-hydroxy-6-hydroxymethyldihydropteridine diphosphokinase [Sporocytophaga sp.]MBO9703082.1 2-amino-4-hydroxy-6-hydroxymethyldihydropteridine diphosphokinase [Sporocytophaga sp.]